MKERRKRRSAKDIEESILDAANQLIENYCCPLKLFEPKN